MKYKFIDDLTSDVMFEAYGKTLEELFSNAADAMFSVICQKGKVQAKDIKEVAVEAESEGKLLIGWLQELIGMVDVDEMFFSRFDVLSIRKVADHGKRTLWTLKARVFGEPISPEKGGTVVKAVTNYGFKLEKTPKGFKARVSLDI
ncbi:MAG: archease [Candidatus Aenigmatarchaeota archaeon]|nr:MAG: archease [Candidatus Aenigmarchaeota archaeon]